MYFDKVRIFLRDCLMLKKREIYFSMMKIKNETIEDMISQIQNSKGKTT